MANDYYEILQIRPHATSTCFILGIIDTIQSIICLNENA